jgi:hypothetical protein
MKRQEQLSEYEREHGKPRPSLLHSVTRTNLRRHLIERHPDFRPLNELTLRLDGRKLTPDISVYVDLDIDFPRDETEVTAPGACSADFLSPARDPGPCG